MGCQTIFNSDNKHNQTKQNTISKTKEVETEIEFAQLGISKREFDVLLLLNKGHSNQEIADKLGLGDSLVAVHTRIEDLPAQYRCDQVIARAFSSLESLAKLAGIAVLKGGQLLAMKGKVPEEELAEVPRPWGVVSIQPLQVPFVEGERCLVTLQRC